MKTTHPLTILCCLVAAACSAGGGAEPPQARGEVAVTEPEPNAPDLQAAAPSQPDAPTSEVATLGAGCFWCIEAVLEQIEGVQDVRSGYMGGQVDDPSYRAVCSGETGHAEVVQVDFDPALLSYEELLDWFWRLHDPTTLDRQGADVGTQYRSAIFVHSPEQRAVAERSRQAAQASFPAPIVTEITEASRFWRAEGYHQDYYRGNKSQRYCQVVIRPKLRKLGLAD